jgi:transposase-like protein
MGTQPELFKPPRCPNCWSTERIEQIGFSKDPAVVFYLCKDCLVTFDVPAGPDQRPVRPVEETP